MKCSVLGMNCLGSIADNHILLYLDIDFCANMYIVT